VALEHDVVPPELLRLLRRGEYERMASLGLEGHPSRALLVIEVADSSLDEDRRVKAPLYAAAGVAEYWIVNLVEGVVEVHRDPRGDRYAAASRHGRSEALALPTFAGLTIVVGDFVPAR
jgi:Uma2 family endonuclease